MPLCAQRENAELRASLFAAQEQVLHMQDAIALSVQEHHLKIQWQRSSNLLHRPTQQTTPQRACSSSGGGSGDGSEAVEGAAAGAAREGQSDAPAAPLLCTPGTLRRYLEGTPGARSVKWVLAAGNTQVKQLRRRAESLAVVADESVAAAAASSASDSMGAADAIDYIAASLCSESGAAANPAAANTGGGGSGDADDGRDVAILQLKVETMRARLARAVQIIEEQDALIHDALVGGPSLAAVSPSRLPAAAVREVDALEQQSDGSGEEQEQQEQTAAPPVAHVSCADLLPAGM